LQSAHIRAAIEQVSAVRPRSHSLGNCPELVSKVCAIGRGNGKDAAKLVPSNNFKPCRHLRQAPPCTHGCARPRFADWAIGRLCDGTSRSVAVMRLRGASPSGPSACRRAAHRVRCRGVWHDPLDVRGPIGFQECGFCGQGGRHARRQARRRSTTLPVFLGRSKNPKRL